MLQKKLKKSLKTKGEENLNELSDISKSFIGYDIGSNKSATDYITSVYNYLESIISSMPCYVYWKNKDFKYLGCNKLTAQLLKLSSRKAIIGMTDYDFGWKKEDVDEFRKLDENIIATGQPRLNVEETITDGSKSINLLVNKMPIFNENHEVIGIVGISIDISDLRKTQNALKDQVKKTELAYQSKAEFLSKASHEIRSPISNLISLLDEFEDNLEKMKKIIYGDILTILNKTNEQELINEITKIVNKVTNSSFEAKTEAYRSLNSLINLGELYKVQTEGIKYKFELSDIKNLIKKAVTNSSYPNNKQIDIRVDVKSDAQPELSIDYRNIYEALCVVIGNAIRFSHEKSIIKIQADIISKDNKSLLAITVQDFGEGISESQLNTLFQTLLMEDANVMDNRYHKPSIQLSLTKMKVEASGGELEIKSSCNKGTLVTLFVPYYSEAEDQKLPKNIKVKDKKTSVLQAILLVEDDARARNLGEQWLDNLGYYVDAAATGIDAVKLASENEYDLILLDITLPDINGVEVMRRIKHHVGDKALFVALTSHASESDIDYFIGEGMVTVLTKPVSKKVLKKCIEDVIASNSDKL